MMPAGGEHLGAAHRDAFGVLIHHAGGKDGVLLLAGALLSDPPAG